MGIQNERIHLSDSKATTSGVLYFTYLDELRENIQQGHIAFSYSGGPYINFRASHNDYCGVIHWENRPAFSNGDHDPESVLEQVETWLACEPAIVACQGTSLEHSYQASMSVSGRAF
jgi:hypothetical protein